MNQKWYNIHVLAYTVLKAACVRYIIDQSSVYGTDIKRPGIYVSRWLTPIYKTLHIVIRTWLTRARPFPAPPPPPHTPSTTNTPRRCFRWLPAFVGFCRTAVVGDARGFFVVLARIVVFLSSDRFRASSPRKNINNFTMPLHAAVPVVDERLSLSFERTSGRSVDRLRISRASRTRSVRRARWRRERFFKFFFDMRGEIIVSTHPPRQHWYQYGVWPFTLQFYADRFFKIFAVDRVDNGTRSIAFIDILSEAYVHGYIVYLRVQWMRIEMQYR